MIWSSVSLFRTVLFHLDCEGIVFIGTVFRIGHSPVASSGLFWVPPPPSFTWHNWPLLCSLSCRAATDHNVDNTTEVLREWLKNVQRLYHYVEWRPMDEPEWVARGHSVNSLRTLLPLTSFPAIQASSLGGGCDLSLFFICISSKFLPLADLHLSPFLFTPAGPSQDPVSHEFTEKHHDGPCFKRVIISIHILSINILYLKDHREKFGCFLYIPGFFTYHILVILL